MAWPLCALSPAPDIFEVGPGDGVPNNPDLPVVLLRKAIEPTASDNSIRDLFEQNGWVGTWTWTVFDFHHFHPNAHEVLAVARGWGEILLGGPDGLAVHFKAGDAVILPAGTGHCRTASSTDFLVCGGYPPGQSAYETLRAGEGGADVAARIAHVPRPTSDPLYGAGGPLLSAWQT